MTPHEPKRLSFKIGAFDLFVLSGATVNLLVAAILIFHHLSH